MLRPCASTHRVYALTHGLCALTHRVYALTHGLCGLTHRVYALTHSRLKVASADPVS
jgi:hypothetical protein